MQDLRKYMDSLYKKNIRSRGLILLAALMLGGCGRALPAQSEFVLGTLCTINLYNKGNPQVYRALFSRLREIDGMMSANRGDSDLARINQNAGLMPVPAQPELITVLSRARYFAALSGGAFDPTIGPLVKLWGIGTDAARVPEDGEIRAALALVNWQDLVIDEQAGTVYLTRPGMALDLGGIAKGYAADALGALIREAGLPRAVIDLGGNIFALGEKAGGKPWRIAVQNPREPRGSYIGILELRDTAVVTSGVYERFLETGGRRYHHILSTGDGYPVDTGLLSVTVIAGNSMDADALSTALFALGYERGRALAESLEGVEAVFVSEDLSVRATESAVFTLEDDAYRLIR
jgi:thiamine biosynthesis lipoprotein